MESSPYGGWQNCARLVCGDTEMIVTLDVGPRIIRYGFIDGENELFENPRDLGKTGGDEYRSYGGHRLWIGPEDSLKTLQPENEAVEYWQEGEAHCFRSAVDRYGMQKELHVTPQPDQGRFLIDHYIYNRGAYGVEFAPWALTVMAPGGTCIFPQEPHEPHSENFLPVRPLVLWSYTEMSDPRWTWGKYLVRLRQDPSLGPQKVGALVSSGCALYANHGNVFLKRFPYEAEYVYPDMGCNFETFTRHDMLEVESLGPLQHVDPGEWAHHPEAWYLLRDQVPPTEEEACAHWFEAIVGGREL